MCRGVGSVPEKQHTPNQESCGDSVVMEMQLMDLAMMWATARRKFGLAWLTR